ncbi:MAG TPA: cellulase family glycosylhydrolase [Actinocrinis sp.]|nr:cellulase family glycosylhydrolase [Actinocrinis sp.]
MYATEPSALTPARRPGRRMLAAISACALAVGAFAVAVANATSAHAASTVGTGFWHTSGSKILDADGNPVRIAGINWYGFETTDEVAHGLYDQDYRSIVDDIKNLGYNTIRIPFSNQMVESPVIPSAISYYNSTGAINTDLKGLNSLQVLQKIVSYAGQDGLKVILDNHRSESGNSAEASGLWYTSTYTNQDWVNDWTTLAKSYAGNPTVIGFDLRNEPHTPSGAAYSTGATWGTGDPATDVRLAYENAGNAILGVDPNALIFAEGIGEFPDSASATGYDSTWWGGDLQGVAQYPVVLSSAGHVVYSAHDYGPDEFQQTWFNSSTTTASLDAVWNKFWGYIPQQNIAPLWVGEFGTGNAAADVSDSTPGSQGQWFSSLLSYIQSNNLGWTYWALNGEDSYGLLDNNYDSTPALAAKQSALAALQFQLGGAGNPPTGGPSTTSTPTTAPPTTAPPTTAPPTTTAPTTPPPGNAACKASLSTQSSWNGGFVDALTVTAGSQALSSWSVTFTWPGDQQITSAWGMNYTQSGKSVTLTNVAYDGSIPAGSSYTNIGFQGTWSASDALPTSISCN